MAGNSRLSTSDFIERLWTNSCWKRTHMSANLGTWCRHLVLGVVWSSNIKGSCKGSEFSNVRKPIWDRYNEGARPRSSVCKLDLKPVRVDRVVPYLKTVRFLCHVAAPRARFLNVVLTRWRWFTLKCPSCRSPLELRIYREWAGYWTMIDISIDVDLAI